MTVEYRVVTSTDDGEIAWDVPIDGNSAIFATEEQRKLVCVGDTVRVDYDEGMPYPEAVHVKSEQTGKWTRIK